MTVPKICGIETEYGIAIREAADFNPDPDFVLADQRLREAGLQARQVGLRGGEPPPGRSGVRAHPEEGSAPEDDSGLVNVILPNGSRYYVDHAHPEYSSPECSNARDVVIWDKAGERILEDSIEAARNVVPDGEQSSSTRTTQTARGTRTAATRTTSWTARPPSPTS